VPVGQEGAGRAPGEGADVVAEDRGEERDDADDPHVEMARTGVERRRDEHRLAGQRHAEVLEEQERPDGEVAVVGERALEMVEDAGQWLGRRIHDDRGQPHSPGAPYTGNQRERSGSTLRSDPSVAFTWSSRALSRLSLPVG